MQVSLVEKKKGFDFSLDNFSRKKSLPMSPGILFQRQIQF